MYEWGERTHTSSSHDAGVAAGKVDWWQLDLESGAVRGYERKARRLGYEPERFCHVDDIADLLSERDRDAVAAALGAHVAGDTASYDVEYRLPAADGVDCWFHDIGGAIERDGTGRPTRLGGVSIDVTDRRRRQDALRLKGQAIDEGPTGIAITDSLAADEPLVYVNETFEQMTGYTADEVLGRNCRFLQCADTDPESVAAMRAAIEAGDAVTVELLNERADGSVFWNEVQLTPLRADDGTVTHYVGFQRDVTARKEHEWKLGQLRERSQAMMHTRTVRETVEVAIGMVDEIVGAPLSGFHRPDGRGERLEPEVTADRVAELFDEQPTYERDAPRGSRAALVWDVFTSGEPRWIDDVGAADDLTEETPANCVLLAPVGEHGLFIVSSPEPAAYTDSDKMFVDIVATMLETALDRVAREAQIRERERRLARQNERMEGLLEATEELLGADTRQQAATLAVTKIAEVLDLPNASLWLHDADRDALEPVACTEAAAELIDQLPTYRPDEESLSWRAFVTGEVDVFDDLTEVPARHNTDTVIGSEIVLPLPEYGVINVGSTEAGAFDGADVTLAKLWARTVTQVFARLANERQLVARNEALSRERDRLDEFAAVVSHDLRNPLNVVEGSLALAETTDETEHFERAQAAVGRMDDLIDDLLSLAKAGEERTAQESVSLSTVARECWQTVSRPDATLTVESDARDDTVYADPARLRQLLENLFRNSVEHGSTSPRSQAHEDSVEHGSTGNRTATPSGDSVEHGSAGNRSQTGDAVEHGSTSNRPQAGDGERSVEITVGLLAGGFFVEDDGPGIEADERDRVRERGYSTLPDGTGFGLSIVAEVAAVHGWTFEITDGSDGGARFEFTGVERETET